ncbi:hypothetical protein QYE76_030541 [Lolium multiflorum]|uniref:CCHC-type domain-containing protein n=1 Tax=Lolium multiflorum TaxID=4521 RepID=A0AAD8QTH9_LOLMU|nr:hypothetical protein QYE76_030541 [Lolium multiflorum]
MGHVKDPAKIVCFKCKIEGHHVRLCPLKKKPLGEKKQGKRPQDGDHGLPQGQAQGLPRLEERPLPKKDQAKAPVVEKSSEKKEKRRTCYICREKGHISSFCTIGAADMSINRARKLREDSMSDALSLAAESNIQVLGLLQRTKGALSRLFSMIFPKMKQDKTLGEMACAFLIDRSEPVEVLKRRSRLFGAVLTFQLLMGHGLGSELEKLSKELPVDDNNCLINLEPFKQSAVTCANQLLKMVDEAKTKTAPEASPGSSSALP